MPYSLEDRLVIGVASSALFDLKESDAVFQEEGEDAYRAFQEAHLDDPLKPGSAFLFIKRLLSLKELSEDVNDPLVEVVVLSKNNPDTGLRVMRSIRHHELEITRAVFTQGQSPYKYMPAFHMSLFLSADEKSVLEAVGQQLPAGRVLTSAAVDDPEEGTRKIRRGSVLQSQGQRFNRDRKKRSFARTRRPEPQRLGSHGKQCILSGRGRQGFGPANLEAPHLLR